MDSVFAGEKQELPAPVRRPAGNEGPELSGGIAKDLRIPEVDPARSGRKHVRGDDGISLVFAVIDPVTDSDALLLDIALLPGMDPCVQEQLPAVVQRYGTAGEAAVPVEGLVGRQGAGKKLPVKKVIAHRMAPVHGSPLGPVGVILVEHVVLPAVVREPVRVVHPADPRREVKGRAVFLPDLSFLFLFMCAGTVQLLSHLSLSQFLEVVIEIFLIDTDIVLEAVLVELLQIGIPLAVTHAVHDPFRPVGADLRNDIRLHV